MPFLAEHNLSFHGHSSKISDPDSGFSWSNLGLHNYNRLLALHLQKKVLALLHSFSSQNAPKIQSDLFYKNFLGGACPQIPPSISMLCMLITVLCTINLTSNFTLYKGPPLIFYAPGPLISLGTPARVYVCMYTPEAINNLWLVLALYDWLNNCSCFSVPFYDSCR